jgi:uncharacterized protein YbjT (DUF2867 family)
VERAIPMIATDDVGRVIAEHLLPSVTPTWKGVKIVELEAAKRYSPNDLAASLSRLLSKEVKYVAVPRNEWSLPVLRSQMLDGFNEVRSSHPCHYVSHLHMNHNMAYIMMV